MVLRVVILTKRKERKGIIEEIREETRNEKRRTAKTLRRQMSSISSHILPFLQFFCSRGRDGRHFLL